MALTTVKETYSVVIPAYNAEKTIEACLASVVAQTLAPLEVLIIDDGSLDGTEVAIRRCEKLFSAAGIELMYFRLKKNSGPSVARNKGILIARGTCIAFLDSDDVWHSHKLAIIDRFASSSTTGLLFHSFSEGLEFDTTTSNSGYHAELLTVYCMLLRNPAATPCTVVRKRDVLAFDESMRYCEDYDLWIRIAERAGILRIVGLPLTRLGRPQLSPGGLSENTLKMRIGEVRVYYNFCRRAWATRVWYLPGLLLFSLFKHLYGSIIRLTR